MVIDKIGKFTVLNTLGSGAHSSILQIRRADDDREYALKLVDIGGKEDLKYLDQAKHEFRVGQMLNHPNLVKVYALETEGGWFSGPKKAKLLIEYVPGRTMDRLPLLKMAKLLRVLERIADGLTHMHKQGVCHADMKPNNLMYDRGTRVKVLDYGLAWVRGESKDRVQGTPEYIAPETVEHKLVNERTDIYNFGATMYRLATLQLPPSWFAGDGMLPMTKKLFKEQLKPVRAANPLVPEGLADLIHQCLQPNATKRPERMSHVQGTLDQLADEAAAKLDDPGVLEE
ncbi:Serine/threonine-protein kinase PrkC [Gemmata obscuriglobus]|uniref:non-specific serine/threonine protein kinase n=1 Tax=Gemmata obscuriglobus TaxID=114 RepID=A0A2Z3GR12_9BACT|nr:MULTISPECIES: serine/threonine-protein kinase [Gemmata]AWM35728.1 serine/threonine protein kinase [Gemmata obscuriglobus]MDY3552478.1 serine/threonine-protein kinase [Gemmata algarum]QEG31739.1 Serine/threonine-protein kinase PrkC [Gemmata obscuriglobus]VTS11085.1 serine threonine protein kinase : Serine/threonine protein kinase OS=Singulisphaera acidiphila (strain ATCC BAA-1392 / DSM 18658 / VKM B-2454 / MOB10) GN=Sinac_6348 PE=3 SV=1: Pkinase [Gemmata obscuriglobus UQM 2246]